MQTRARKSNEALEKIVSVLLENGEKNIIGIALDIYNIANEDPSLKTMIRNLSNVEINEAFKLALTRGD